MSRSFVRGNQVCYEDVQLNVVCTHVKVPEGLREFIENNLTPQKASDPVIDAFVQLAMPFVKVGVLEKTVHEIVERVGELERKNEQLAKEMGRMEKDLALLINAFRELILALVDEGIISVGKGASLTLMSYEDFVKYAKKRGVKIFKA